MTRWTPAALEKSRELAVELGQFPLDGSWRAACPDDADFIAYSRTRPGLAYPMLRTPEGFAVHQGEGCEGEIFNGPLGCWHSKEYSTVTTAVTTYESQLPARQFSNEDITVLKQTICKGASDAELNLFIATCKHTGLDPFLKQIHAIKRKTNEGSRENPKWVEVMTIQVGIDGYRVIRDRLRDSEGHSMFEGLDGPQWSEDGKAWTDVPESGKPHFARVGVWRRGVPRPFIAIARWEAYDQNNSMWQRNGPEQLAKCAEALGYRRAFPADMSSLPHGALVEEEEMLPAAEWQQQEQIIEGDYAPADEHGEGEAEGGAQPAATLAASGVPSPAPPDDVQAPTRPAPPTPPPAPTPGPDAMPTNLVEYRATVVVAIEAAGHDRDAIEAAAQQAFGNRGIGQLGAKEMQQLARDHGVEVALPGQPALVPAGAN